MADTPRYPVTLAFDVARVTEATAIAAWNLAGRGDEREAHEVAVSAMRAALNAVDIEGRVVIGDGQQDGADQLAVGQSVGTGSGPQVDVALDPLEGTTLTAKAQANALSVLAISPPGGLMNVPDIYMDKIACGPGYPSGLVDLDRSPQANVRALADAKGVAPAEITVCVMDRPRHGALVEALRDVGAKVLLISDGDIAGVIHTTEPGTGIDLYLGSGGAPEGVLAAAAMKCVGGHFQGRLIYRNDHDRAEASRAGIDDLERKYDLHDLVSTDAVFAATGVTKGAMLDGVRIRRGHVSTHTVTMDSFNNSVRRIRTTRPL